jgi:PKD repeat protein
VTGTTVVRGYVLCSAVLLAALAPLPLSPVLASTVQLAESAAAHAQSVSESVPVLQLPQPMKVDPGGTADQIVHATDADGDPLSFAKLSGPAYMTVTTIDAGTGTAIGNIRLAPPPGTPLGTTLAEISVSDGVASGHASVRIVIGTNPPTLDSPANMTVSEAAIAEQTLSGSDPDLDPLTFYLVSGPSFVTVATTEFDQGVIRLAPGVADEGVYPVVVAVGDGTATDAKSLVVTVTHADVAPELEQPADMTVNSGETADQILRATDFDGDPLTFFKLGGPAFVTMTTTDPGTGSATGNVHVAPTIADATTPDESRRYGVLAEVGDGTLSAVRQFWVTVNFPPDHPPVLDPPADMTVTQGTSATMPLMAADPDGDQVGFRLVDGPEFVFIGYQPSIGWFVRASPSFLHSGSYLVTVRAVDVRGLSDEGLFHVIVADGDEPPIVVDLRDVLAFTDQIKTQDFHAYDPEGNPLIFSKSVGPDFMTVETVDPGPNGATGRIRLAPTSGDLGKTAGGVLVSDGAVSSNWWLGIDVRPPGIPVLSPVFDMCIRRGDSRSLVLRAVDPEGDRLAYRQIGLPPYASLVDSGNGNASLVVLPGPDAPAGGSFVTVTVSDGSHEAIDLFTITVGSDADCGRRSGDILLSGPANGHPHASAGGPYTGMAGIPIQFDGSQSSDPEGMPVQFAWSLGDGSVAVGSTPLHTYARGSQYTIVLIVSDGYITGRETTTASIADAFAARVFTPDGQSRVRLFSGKPTLCVNVEPVNGSFQLSDVDAATLSMVYPGTGSVDRIAAIGRNTATFEDSDGNGVEEVRICFAQDDVRRLFRGVSGAITVQVEGNLRTGGILRGNLPLTILPTHGPAAASVSPNPINPSGTLRFSTTTAGEVTIRLFDPSGRLVRTLLTRQKLEAGEHTVTIDGRDTRGLTLATGVYFYRIEMPGARSQGRFVVAK